MFQSELADMLVSGAAALVYMTGLVGFVVWLERRGPRHKIAAQ